MLNEVRIIGNLGRDAELRHTNDGTAVVNMSVGCSRKWKDRNDQMREETEWVKVVYFGKGAEAVHPYLVKGKQVFCAGSLQTRKWEKDGQTKYSTEVKADRVDLLGRKERDEHDQRREPRGGRYEVPGDEEMAF